MRPATKRNARPAVEVLEGKALLSGAQAVLPVYTLAAVHETAPPQPGILHENFHVNKNGLLTTFGQAYLAPTGSIVTQHYTVSVHRNTLARPTSAPNFDNVTSVFVQELASQVVGLGTVGTHNGFVVVDGTDSGFIRHETFHNGRNGVSLDMTFVAPSGYVYEEHYSLASRQSVTGLPGSSFTNFDAVNEFNTELSNRLAAGA